MKYEDEERELETWENTSASTFGVNRFTGVGHETRQEIIRPGRKFLISTKERRMLNSDRSYAEHVDPFKNGFFRPVELVESSTDLNENPNPHHMSTTDLRSLFRVRKIDEFRTVLEEFDSPQILTAMADLAANHPDVNATVKQAEAIEIRLEEVTPDTVTQIATSGTNFSEDDERKQSQSFRLRE